jgi:hypothetical protein
MSTNDVLMLVNLQAPATAAGSVNSVTLVWRAVNNQPCSNSFRVRFFRKSLVGSTYTATATRGPFNSADGQLTIPIAPPVDVQPGDVIGIVQATSTTCGGVVIADGGKSLQTAYVRGDLQTFGLSSADLLQGAVSVRASVDGRVREGVIPVVGSAPGANGSFFKTSLHLATPTSASAPIVGELVFRRAGQAASTADVKMPFTIPAKSALFYEDVVAAMGQSGLGTIDIYTKSSATPIATTRVFDDKGAQGTSGFSQEFFQLSQAVSRGWSVVPIAGGANFRTNIGIRSVGAGTTVSIGLYSKEGQFLGVQLKTIGAEAFEQVPLSALFGTSNPVNGYLNIALNNGAPYIAYVSTTDNRTNDSSIQFAKPAGQ